MKSVAPLSADRWDSLIPSEDSEVLLLGPNLFFRKRLPAILTPLPFDTTHNRSSGFYYSSAARARIMESQ